MLGLNRLLCCKAAFIATAAGLLLCTAGNAARTEPFTFDDIRFWVGRGQNRAALVVYWSDTALCLVWGYRFDGTSTGEQMLMAIARGERRSGHNGPVLARSKGPIRA